MARNSKPMVRIEVIASNDPKEEVLALVERKERTQFGAATEFTSTDHGPELCVEFGSLGDFQARFGITGENFDFYYKLAVAHKISSDNLQILKETSNNLSGDLYAILKYTTDHKALLRKWFLCMIQLVEIVGLGITFEETEEGVLIFFETRTDFEASLLNLRDNAQIRAWLHTHNWMTDSIRLLLDTAEKNLEK